MTARRRCGVCGQFIRIAILLTDGSVIGWEHRHCARRKGMAAILPPARVGTIQAVA